MHEPRFKYLNEYYVKDADDPKGKLITLEKYNEFEDKVRAGSFANPQVTFTDDTPFWRKTPTEDWIRRKDFSVQWWDAPGMPGIKMYKGEGKEEKLILDLPGLPPTSRPATYTQIFWVKVTAKHPDREEPFVKNWKKLAEFISDGKKWNYQDLK